MNTVAVERYRHRVRPIRHAEFHVNVLEVRLDRRLADVQMLGDTPVRKSSCVFLQVLCLSSLLILRAAQTGSPGKVHVIGAYYRTSVISRS